LIAAIRHHFGKPTAYAYLPFRLPKQKEPAIGGLISSIKINCEFLAMDGWQIEGEQSSFRHDGCGVALLREALVSTATCYVNLAAFATAVTLFLTSDA
jgi:hypothetical protein